MPQGDIYRHKRLWDDYVSRDYLLEGFSKENKFILKEFLRDFERGINVPKSSKGKRAPGTLIKLRHIGIFLNKHIKKDFDKITKKDLHNLFNSMLEGKVKREDGRIYRDVTDFIKCTKTFVGWLIKTKRIEEDITEDLSRASYDKGKPSWVYLTQEQMKKLIDNARGDYRALIYFLYDSGIRPQEAYRLYVGDLQFNKDETLLTIPEKRADGSRVSKTFERTIKLKYCSTFLKSYIETNQLKSSDLLIIPSQPAFNKYLRELSKKLFGSQVTKARGRTDQLKLYDIRHISSIFWLDKYKTHKDLMYRMGWKKEDKIIYYTEFLGRRDKIDDEDMITSEDKNRYEKQIEKLNKAQELSDKKQELMWQVISELTNLDEDALKEIIQMKQSKKMVKIYSPEQLTLK